MDYDIAIEWLTAWRRRSVCLAILGAAGGFVFSVVLLILAWAFVFMVSLYLLGGWIPHDVGWWHSVIAMIAIPLLFIGNACVSQETLGQYSFTTGTATDNLVIVPGIGSNVNPIDEGACRHRHVGRERRCLYSTGLHEVGNVP